MRRKQTNPVPIREILACVYPDCPACHGLGGEDDLSGRFIECSECYGSGRVPRAMFAALVEKYAPKGEKF